MRIENLVPPSISEARGRRGRVDDVREEHRAEGTVGGRRWAAPGQELRDGFERVVLTTRGAAQVERSREREQLRSGKVLGEVLGLDERDDRILGPMHDEGAVRDRGKGVADIEAKVAGHDLAHQARRRRVPLEAGERLGGVGVGGHVRDEHPDRLARPPCVAEQIDELPPERFVDEAAPQQTPAEGPPEHQGIHPLRVRGGEQERERTTLGDGHDGCTLDLAGVEHCTQIVHALLRGPEADRPVRQSGSAFVEGHEPPEAAQVVDPVAVDRALPHELGVGHESRDVEDRPA